MEQEIINNNESNIPGDEARQMRGLLREMAEFIALYETMKGEFQDREKKLEEKLVASEIRLADQLRSIKNVIKDFETIMTEAGAARWRLTTEKALKEGNTYMQALQETSSEVTHSIKEGCVQLEQVATQTISGVAKATSTLPIEDFKRVAEQGSEQIKNMSLTAVKNIADLTQWFHWKNLAMAFALTMFVIFITGLYVNDEWPWETHSHVVKERTAGRALLAAWPHLSVAQQQNIISYAGKKSV